MSFLTARTITALSSVFPTYAEARAAELAERRRSEVHAEASLHLLRR
ncbi:MAG TPA: hypothetical protein VKY71_01890 [Actinotalea caeni]|nr:hypothetical protein [Actinotalea caeni]HLV54308.1 hypothetical protein [Actinotalea caeni]